MKRLELPPASVLVCGACGVRFVVLIDAEAELAELEAPCPECGRNALGLDGPLAYVLPPAGSGRRGAGVLAAALAAALGRARMEGLDVSARRKLAASGGRAAWDGMTPAQRSNEMSRRARRRRKVSK